MSVDQMLFCNNCMSFIEDGSTGYCPNCGQQLGVQSDVPQCQLPVNTQLNGGRYSVGEVIEIGDFDITYEGYDFQLQTKVFIKETFYRGIFNRNTADGTTDVSFNYEFPIEEINRKVSKECLSISGCRGLSNIVKILDWFNENNTSYIITEYIEGITLDDWIARSGRLGWQELYRKMKPILTGLSVLHSKNIYHRNINPRTIVINSSTMEYMLIDPAICRSTDVRYLTSALTSFVTGFQPYEQRAFIMEDGAYTDIYSVTASMYYALTGELPADEMYDAVEGNFPRISMLHTHYSVPDNIEQGFRIALDPHVNTRCQDLNSLMQILNEENRQPHYLYGKHDDSESAYAKEARKRVMGKSREQVKTEYYERIVEKQKEDDLQQMNINTTLDKLQPKYARRVASYDRSLMSTKGLIIPVIFVAIVVFLIIMGNRG